jgi:hypothetical protein
VRVKLRGVAGPTALEVVRTEWIGADALNVVYRGADTPAEGLLFRDANPRLEFAHLDLPEGQLLVQAQSPSSNRHAGRAIGRYVASTERLFANEYGTKAIVDQRSRRLSLV